MTEAAVPSIRKAMVGDVPRIQELVKVFAGSGEMLPRSLAELYEGVRDFFVAESGEVVVGCCALHVNWEELAEVRTLAVEPDFQGRGIGRRLVDACLQEAGTLGVSRVYALTYRPGFFARLGFARVDKESLPHKVWADCLRCPQFPNCQEEAMVLELPAPAGDGR